MMTRSNLFQEGQEAFERGEYLQSLQCFLQVRAHRLDRVQAWSVNAGVTKLRLRDVNHDASEEIGAVSTRGEFAIFSFAPESRGYVWQGHPCQSFVFLTRSDQEGQQVACVILASSTRGIICCPRYEVKRAGGRTLSFSKIRDLKPSIEGVEIHDIAVKRRKIYISTSNRKIYQYSSVTLELELVRELDTAVRWLNTGGMQTERAPQSFMYDRLLGVCQDGGLLQFNVGEGEVQAGIQD